MSARNVLLMSFVVGVIASGLPLSAQTIQLQQGTATFTQPGCSPDACYDGVISPPNGYGSWAIAENASLCATPNPNGQVAVWETSTNVNAGTITFTMYHQNSSDCFELIGRFRWSVTTDDRSTFADGADNNGAVAANWTVLVNPTSVTVPPPMAATVLGDSSILTSLAGGAVCPNSTGNVGPCTGDYIVTYPVPPGIACGPGITGIRLEVMKDPSLPCCGPGHHTTPTAGGGNFELTELVVTYTPPPCAPKALQIANANGYVSVPSAPDLEPCSGVTVEAWVNYNPSFVNGGNGSPTIVRKGPIHPASPYNLRVYDVTQKLNWIVATSTLPGLVSVEDPNPFPQSTWTHVAGTYDGSLITLYVNGIQVNQLSVTGALVPGGELRIGKGEDNYPEYWGGAIDEVRIWSFARTAAEITGGMTHAHEVGNLPGTVAVWNLNGNLTDATGAHNGVAVGSPAFTASGAPLVGTFPGSTFPYGASSPAACAPGLPTAAITSLPRAVAGNPGFGVASTCAPPFAFGFLVVSSAPLAIPTSIFGIDLWVAPAAPSYITAVGVAADAVGFLRAPVPIAPNNGSGLLGQTFELQFVWLGGCSPGGMVASGGMQVTFVP